MRIGVPLGNPTRLWQAGTPVPAAAKLASFGFGFGVLGSRMSAQIDLPILSRF
jgi:hypothetical protein